MADSAPPKLFISYSQSDPAHVKWVIDLATKLKNSDIAVMLDKWDLKAGDDAIAYMEEMVDTPDIQKVLIISNKSYVDKATKRSGRVGTETQIIPRKIYSQQKPNKFVVAVAEKDKTGKPYLPTYYKARIYIDLAEEEKYDEGVDEIIEWVLDKSPHKKPEIESFPLFIDDEDAILLGTTDSYKTAIHAIKTDSNSAAGAIDEYLSIFSKNLERFRIKNDVFNNDFDDLIVKNIEQFIPHRNELIGLFDHIANYAPTEENMKKIHRFFERIIPYMHESEQINNYPWGIDNFKFIVHELFLYAIAVFIKKEKFSSANYLLENQYYLNLSGSDAVMFGFVKTNDYIESLYSRNSRLKLNRLPIRAVLLKERCVNLNIGFVDLMQADFILFLRRMIEVIRENKSPHISNREWWPETLVYVNYTFKPFEIFARSISKKYYDQVKVLLGINEASDHRNLWKAYNKLPREAGCPLPRENLLHYEKLATLNYERLATFPQSMELKISKATLRNFKQFKEVTFNLDGNVVIAGPNNCGKTTLLQAIAAWSLALECWRELNNYHRRRGAYSRAPIARQAFYPVPLRAFDLLWNERDARNCIEIEITGDMGCISIEIKSDSSEQVYVRPLKNVNPDLLRNAGNFPKPVFVPAMTGLSTEEPVYQQPKINQLLGQGKPGDVLRNLLVETNHNQDAWERLTKSIESMFGYELLPPDTAGPNIVSEYRHQKGGTKYDIASAGSGFLQVLMLLTFLNSRPGTVLLLDEPDAHLHVILQDGIYSELRNAAQKSNSQLIIATHSEVVINAVDPRELCALLGNPRKLARDDQKSSLIRSLSVLSNMDIMLALQKKKILYVEGHTDLNILRAWATILNHRLKDFLAQPFWKPAVSESRSGAKGVQAQDHFESLSLAQEEIRGVQISDRDGNENIPPSKKVFDDRLLKLCWTRYEIESYLLNPVILARFVDKAVGTGTQSANIEAMKKVMRTHLPGVVVDKPENGDAYLIGIKAKPILSKIFADSDLHRFPDTRYFEIAEIMQADEIHPAVVACLDAVADHFNL